ncbi:hypothetical protein E2542_SST12959 [Spatholobus suberectus]|nr:hypothetical protein E2542_SST12959 [Spatholobus suberectus]
MASSATDDNQRSAKRVAVVGAGVRLTVWIVIVGLAGFRLVVVGSMKPYPSCAGRFLNTVDIGFMLS